MHKMMMALAACFALSLCLMLYWEGAGVLHEQKKQCDEDSSVRRPAEVVTYTEPTTEESDEQKVSMPQDSISTETAEEIFFPVEGEVPSNNELQLYLASQTKIQENQLELTAIPEYGTYLSGKAESKIAVRYGTYEFLIHPVEGKGLFPAIWLLPDNGDSLPELDIYEAIGNKPNEFFGVIHYAERNKNKKEYFEYEFPDGAPRENYRLRFEWQPDEMTWYLNDAVIYRMTEYVPSSYMYMIINLAVGGNWAGAPDEDTQYPAAFQVEMLQFNPAETQNRRL